MAFNLLDRKRKLRQSHICIYIFIYTYVRLKQVLLFKASIKKALRNNGLSVSESETY